MPDVPPDGAQSLHNEDFPWDQFDTEAYLEHNYAHVRHDDREILDAVSSFFERACAEKELLHGIDVGTGANLYPTLAMLPFCRKITLLEYSRSNVRWLRWQRRRLWPSWKANWQAFWQVLRKLDAYKGVAKPRWALIRRARVCRRSVFDLPRDHLYGIGTMFFVAESITPEHDEFDSAMEHFLGALAPGAPFAIALMEHSGGYQVGDKLFPATDIDIADVEKFLNSKAADVKVELIGPGVEPVREGYTGMIIAYGCARDVELVVTGDDRENSTAAADARRVAGGSQILTA